MTKIEIDTTVAITNSDGHILTLRATTVLRPGDNPRYFKTYTRGGCQELEHSIAQMLDSKYGDVSNG